MNGSLALPGQTVGGGDMVLFKFIRLSGNYPAVLIPRTAQGFAVNAGKFFLTRGNGPLTLIKMLALFFARTVQGIIWSRRNQKTYDVALSASPFSVDVIPVWFWKARRKGAVIYHLLPHRKAVSVATFFRFGIARLEQKIMLAILRRACDFFIAGNDFTKSQLTALMPGKPIFILPAGFDAAHIDQMPAQTKDPNLACFVGRLVSQKGIFDLLKVMEKLQQSLPRFRLVMAGTGPEQDFFTAEIKRMKLTNIELAGFVSEEQKIALLKRSQYFFFPSYEEGWGIALAEALYCECRCLCYELPHYRSIFGGYPVYVKLGDPQDFVRAFHEAGPVAAGQKSFLRQYDDPVIAQTLSEHLSSVAREDRRA